MLKHIDLGKLVVRKGYIMAIELFNSSLELGSLFNHMTLNFTGNIALTLIFVLAFLLMLALMFRIPILLSLIVLMPLLIVFSDYDYTGMFYTILGIIALILGVVLARSIFAYR